MAQINDHLTLKEAHKILNEAAELANQELKIAELEYEYQDAVFRGGVNDRDGDTDNNMLPGIEDSFNNFSNTVKKKLKIVAYNLNADRLCNDLRSRKKYSLIVFIQCLFELICLFYKFCILIHTSVSGTVYKILPAFLAYPLMSMWTLMCIASVYQLLLILGGAMTLGNDSNFLINNLSRACSLAGSALGVPTNTKALLKASRQHLIPYIKYSTHHLGKDSTMLQTIHASALGYINGAENTNFLCDYRVANSVLPYCYMDKTMADGLRTLNDEVLDYKDLSMTPNMVKPLFKTLEALPEYIHDSFYSSTEYIHKNAKRLSRKLIQKHPGLKMPLHQRQARLIAKDLKSIFIMSNIIINTTMSTLESYNYPNVTS